MTPAELAARLRAMADKVDRSKNPSASAVQRDVLRLSIELQEESYEAALSEQEAQSAHLPGSRRPAQVSVNVSDADAYDRTMKGFQRRASRR